MTDALEKIPPPKILLTVFELFDTLTYPSDEATLRSTVQRALSNS